MKSITVTIRPKEGRSKRFNIDFEISAKLAKYKYNYKECSISYNPRKYSEGKKINFKDAIEALLTIFKIYIFK